MSRGESVGRVSRPVLECLPWAALIVSVLVVAARADEGAEPLRYRRLLVPEESLDEQVQGLLPIKRAEFERRIKEAAEQSDPQLGATLAWVERAEYRARLVGEHLVEGTAALSVATRREGLSWLDWSGCNLALASSTWKGPPETAAVVGAGPSGRLVCLVPASGELDLAWSLRGQRPADQNLEFAVHLPPATRSTILIELPAGLKLVTDHGVVTQAASGEPAEESHVWSIALGGRQQVTLRVEPAIAAPAARPLVLVKDSLTYSVQSSGIDLDAALGLEVLHGDVSELTLVIDAPLDITALTCGDQPVSWTPVPDIDGIQQVRVVLPAPLNGAGHELRVQGFSSWPAGRAWRLPRIRVADGVWEEGRASVLAAATLELDVAPLGGCRQTGFVPAAPPPSEPNGPRSIESFHFQFFLPDAALEVRSTASLPILMEASGTELKFEKSQVLATQITELTASRGQVFEVTAAISRQWIVDSVDVQPAGWLEDRVLTPGRAGNQTLRLALRRAVSADRPLRIVVKARAPRPAAGQPLADEAFPLATILFAAASRRLVAIRNQDSGLALDAAPLNDAQRVDPAALTGADLRLFEAAPGPVLLDLQERGRFRVELAAASARMRAQLSVFAACEADQLRQVIRIRCEPESSPISQVTVHVQPPLPEALAWRIVGEEDRELVLRRASRSPRETIYELQLQRPRSASFEISAEVATPLGGSVEVALPSVPTAAAQRGSVEVHDLGGPAFSIAAPGLVKLPPGGQQETIDTLRGAFQFDPGRQSQMHLRLAGSGQLPSAWARSEVVRSRFSADGTGEHHAVFFLENLGARVFEFTLSPAVSDVSIQVNDSAEKTARRGPTPGHFVVPLPAGKRRATVSVRYLAAAGSRGRGFAPAFVAPLPQTSLAVLSSQWEVELAPGWAVSSNAKSSSRWPGTNWLQWPQGSSPHAPREVPRAHHAERDGLPGWSVHRLPLPAGPAAEVSVYRPGQRWAWAAAIGLATCALAVRLLPARPWRLLLVAGIVLAIGRELPAESAALWCGAGWGLAAAACAALLLPAHRPHGTVALTGHDSSRPDSSRHCEARSRALLIVLVAATWHTSGTVTGAPPARGDGPWRRVVIPINNERQPTGDYAFLDPELYDALLALSPSSGREPWVVRSARYRVSGPPRLGAAAPQVDEIKAEWEVETFVADALVQLPLARATAHLLEGRAALDAAPLTPQWSSDGAALEVNIPSPGKHHIELTFRAVVEVLGDGLLLDIATARAPVSEVQFPEASAMPPEVLSAQGAPWSASLGDGRWQLGSAPRLQIKWPLPDHAAERAARVRAEQLALWRIRPGSVVADVRLRLEPLGGSIQEVVVRVAPQLRPLPLAAAQGIASLRVEEGPTGNLLHLVLQKPIQAETSIEFSLLWVGSSGLGKLVLPAIDVQADEVARNWEGALLGEGLAWDSPEAGENDPLAAQFLDEWGAGARGTFAAWARSPVMPRTLEVRPAPSEIRAEETLRASIAQELVTLHYAARLSGVPASAYRHRLQLSTPARVTVLTARDGERSIPLRWSQDGGGEVTVLLAQAPPRELLLEVEAVRARDPKPSRLPLPIIHYLDADVATSVVHVYRSPDSLVSLLNLPKSWTRLNLPAPPAGGNEGRWLFTFEQSPAKASPPPLLEVKTNQPQLRGQLAIRAGQFETLWRAEALCDFQVQGGALDALQLYIPSTWTGPWEISPAAEHRLVTVPGEARRLLVVEPAAAWTDRVQLTIRGPLQTVAGEAPGVPEVNVADAAEIERFVVLPKQTAAGPAIWETSGLQLADPSQLTLPKDWRLAPSELFQVVAPRYTATARIRPPAAAAAAVALADYLVELGENRQYWGRAMFDFQPALARSLTLELDPGCRLVSVAVEGLPATPTRLASRRWEVPLAADRVPQRMEVIFSGTALESGPASRGRIAAPHLSALSVQRTMWTISGDAGATLRADSTFKTMESEEAQVVRQESIARLLLSLASPQAADYPRAGLASSFRTWSRRFAECRPAGREEKPSTNESLAARQAATLQKFQAARDALVAAGTIRNGDVLSPPIAEVESQSLSGVSAYLTTEQSRPVDVLMAAHDETHGGLWWPALALGGGVVLAWLLAGSILRSWSISNPAAAVAAVGVGLILALPATWPGWLLLALAVWIAMAWPWPRSATEAQASALRREA